jgi:hypothetical protein
MEEERMKYRITCSSGAYKEIETRGGYATAVKKSGFSDCSIATVARMRVAPFLYQLKTEGMIEVTLDSGAVMIGSLEQINKTLSAMGYETVAIRANLRSGKKFIEAENTPGYLSPASEAYWSM